MMELYLHSDRAERLDQMRLIRKHQTMVIGIEDRFGQRIKNAIRDTAIQHTDDAPDSGLGAVFAPQPGEQRSFIEYGRAFLRHQRRLR